MLKSFQMERITLSDWIKNKLRERDWIPADLVRSARAKGHTMSDATLSRIMNETRKPGRSSLIAIADGFDEPPEMVFLLIENRLDSGQEEDITLKKLYDLGKRLSPEERERLLSIAELFFREEQARDRAKKNLPPGSAAIESTS